MNHRILTRINMGLVFAVCVSSANAARWYNDAQVKRGGQLFADNCAACHGSQAQGISPDWRKTDADGNYPPPPLNGTAHAWHHPMKILRSTIRNGGAPVGGRMPAFKDTLKPDEMDAIIAWFQSHWNDEIYQAWSERDRSAGGFKPIAVRSDTATASDVESKTAVIAKPSPAQAALQRLLPNSQLKPPQASPVEGIVAIATGGVQVYVTEDGRYAFSGDLIDLSDGSNLSEKERRKWRVKQLSGFPIDQRVIYPARGTEKASITVFTDTSCPFCRKQHSEIDTLLDAGVSVHYIPFPRGGRAGPGYASLRGIWCAADPLKAMTEAKTDPGLAPLPGDCGKAQAVDAGYRLGNTLGIRGTPASVLNSGELVDGYRSATDLLKSLGLAAAK